jgi:hypothetical protein
MCGSKPKPPPPADTSVDQELIIQRQAAEEQDAALKAVNKQSRMDQSLALMSGRMGRKSLFTGSQGGAGYPRSRSLVPVPGAMPRPAGPPAMMPGPVGTEAPVVAVPNTGIRRRFDGGFRVGRSLIQ